MWHECCACTGSPSVVIRESPQLVVDGSGWNLSRITQVKLIYLNAIASSYVLPMNFAALSVRICVVLPLFNIDVEAMPFLTTGSPSVV